MLTNVRIEATDNVLHVSVTGKLTREDYAEFVPAIEDLIETRGTIRVLFEMHDFHGWTAGALWDDVRFDMKHFRDIDRLAVVGEKPWQKGLTAFCRPFTTARIRYFPADELEDANRWLHETAENEHLDVPKDIAKLLDTLVGTDGAARERARSELVQKGASVVGFLHKATTSENRKLRWEVTKTLAEIADPSAATALAEQLDDTFGVSWAAAEGLTKLGRPGAEAVLHHLIRNSRSHNTRTGAHHALGHMEDLAVRQAVAPVLAALDDAAPVEQAPVAASEALDALRRLGAS